MSLVVGVRCSFRGDAGSADSRSYRATEDCMASSAPDAHRYFVRPSGAGERGARSRRQPEATFAAPRVTVVVNTQSDAASFVSRPSGLRLSEPATVFESATAAGSTVPSTRLTVAGPICAAVIAPSYESASRSAPVPVSTSATPSGDPFCASIATARCAPDASVPVSGLAVVLEPVRAVDEDEREPGEVGRFGAVVPELDEAVAVRPDLVVVDLVEHDGAGRQEVAAAACRPPRSSARSRRRSPSRRRPCRRRRRRTSSGCPPDPRSPRSDWPARAARPGPGAGGTLRGLRTRRAFRGACRDPLDPRRSRSSSARTACTPCPRTARAGNRSCGGTR